MEVNLKCGTLLLGLGSILGIGVDSLMKKTEKIFQIKVSVFCIRIHIKIIFDEADCICSLCPKFAQIVK
jgi:hypothetical protein